MSFGGSRGLVLFGGKPPTVQAAPAGLAAATMLADYKVNLAGSTPYTTPGTTTAAAVGDLVVVGVHSVNAITGGSPLTDSAGNTWSTNVVLTANGKFQLFWSKITHAMPVGTTFGYTVGGSTTSDALLTAVVVPGAGTLDVTGVSNTATSTTMSLSFNPTVSAPTTELAVMFAYWNGGGDALSTASIPGWTLLAGSRTSPASPNTKFNSTLVFTKPITASGNDTSFSTTSPTSGAWAAQVTTVKSS